MARPEGYRQAVRLMDAAERFQPAGPSPFVDTRGRLSGPGAAEARSRPRPSPAPPSAA
ncbi:hypothetical protein ACRAWD_06575 [Caulobacter segnis]